MGALDFTRWPTGRPAATSSPIDALAPARTARRERDGAGSLESREAPRASFETLVDRLADAAEDARESAARARDARRASAREDALETRDRAERGSARRESTPGLRDRARRAVERDDAHERPARAPARSDAASTHADAAFPWTLPMNPSLWRLDAKRDGGAGADRDSIDAVAESTIGGRDEGDVMHAPAGSAAGADAAVSGDASLAGTPEAQAAAALSDGGGQVFGSVSDVAGSDAANGCGYGNGVDASGDVTALADVHAAATAGAAIAGSGFAGAPDAPGESGSSMSAADGLAGAMSAAAGGGDAGRAVAGAGVSGFGDATGGSLTGSDSSDASPAIGSASASPLYGAMSTGRDASRTSAHGSLVGGEPRAAAADPASSAHAPTIAIDVAFDGADGGAAFASGLTAGSTGRSAATGASPGQTAAIANGAVAGADASGGDRARWLALQELQRALDASGTGAGAAAVGSAGTAAGTGNGAMFPGVSASQQASAAGADGAGSLGLVSQSGASRPGTAGPAVFSNGAAESGTQHAATASGDAAARHAASSVLQSSHSAASANDATIGSSAVDASSFLAGSASAIDLASGADGGAHADTDSTERRGDAALTNASTLRFAGDTATAGGSASSSFDLRALSSNALGAPLDLHDADNNASAAGSAIRTTASPEEQGAQIVRSMRLHWRGNNGEAQLRLHPDHLGPVLVNVKVEQGVVSATLHAETQGAQQWIQAHQQQLRDALDAQGLRVAQFHVTSNPDDRPRRDREQEDAKQHRARRLSTPDDSDAQRFEIRI